MERDTLRPRFTSSVCCTVLPPEGVILLSERGYLSLRGDAYIHLAPLLEGQHTVDEIFDRLQGQMPAPEVFQALTHLHRNGLITHAPRVLPAKHAAFWDMMEVEEEDTVQRLQEATVVVVAFGDIDPAPFKAMLASVGVRVADAGEYAVVLTDNYLNPALDSFNRETLTEQRSWLLVKPVGTELWIGPLFLPRETGCWACLAHRLQESQKVENYLQEKTGAPAQFSIPLAALPSTLHTALSITATETAKWIVCGRNTSLEGQIITLDTLSFTKDTHTLVRRPQCPRCGDPCAFTAKQFAPLVLQRRQKIVTTTDGHYSAAPEEMWRKLKHHISPLTGIVHTLRPTAPGTGEHTLTPSYVTGHNFVYVAKDDALDLDFLEASLQGGSSGKGRQPVQAKVSALCESIERYSGLFQGDEARIQASYKDLETAAIHPNSCMLFSERQFENREQWNREGVPSTWVPEWLDDDREIEWSPVWSLTYNEPRYVPTALCYYGYSRQRNAWYARADSNGCAAGQSKEEAIIQGFTELVERDGVALWWYNRLQRPRVALSSFDEPYFQELDTYYRTLHRDLWVLDITSDLNVPTFVAVSHCEGQGEEQIILGFGSHFDPKIAILRALTELNLQLPFLSSVMSEKNAGSLSANAQVISWWKNATLEEYPALIPDKSIVPKGQADYSSCWSDDLHTDVVAYVRIAEAKGLETLVLDQTRPDMGLHVVKVFVPGLRHFWPRFGPGRLYDVPVQMEWTTDPLSEDQVDPQPLYLSFQS